MSKKVYWRSELAQQEKASRVNQIITDLTAKGTDRAKMVAIALDYYSNNRDSQSHEDWVKLRHKLEAEAKKILGEI